MTKKLLSMFLCVLLLMSSVLVAYAEDTTTEGDTSTVTENPYTVASQQLDEKYGYNGDDLGATYTPESTTFKVWSPTATSVVVNLYTTGSDYEEGASDLGSYTMTQVLDEDEFTGVWSVTIKGDLKNIYYTYTVTATNVTGEETTTIETADIYSVASGVNSKRSMVCDLDGTDPIGWENDTHVLLDKSTDSVVWEIHVKDFTYSESSGVSEANRGKYLGFTETGTTLNGEGNISTCIDYLKDLGVTTVQILPFYDYGSVDEAGADTQFNWGYDPMNYNVPEGSYSSNPYDGNVRIRECKQMIQALHNAGFSVVMDVVYNHTYSYDSVFEAIVPNYYYRMTSDGDYSNGSGCGNETASERLMYRNYIIQSCLYWVNEFHVDGFRFDLMGCMDCETMNMIRAELDKVDERITMWGEGWTGGSCTYPETTCTGETLKPAIIENAKNFLDKDIAIFNDKMRDGLKGSSLNKEDMGWVQGLKSFSTDVYFGLLANAESNNWTLSYPTQCVTYASCHDNSTLWDKLCDANYLSEYYDKRNEKVLLENKLTAGLLSVSQGILFFNAGEEMGRTKMGDHNSYSSPAELNMIDWTLLATNSDLVSYYQGLLDIRSNFAPITNNNPSGRGVGKSLQGYLVYSGRTGENLIAMTIDNTTEGQWEKLAVLANNSEEDMVYKFPVTVKEKEWVIIANNETAGVKKIDEISDGYFTIPARSIIIAVNKSSFDEVSLGSNMGKLTVNHIDELTGEIMDKSVITGTIGKGYQTVTSTSIPLEYKFAYVDKDTSSVFTEEDQVVNYYYNYFVPSSMNNDVTGDGYLTVKDANAIQRHLAGIATLDEASLKLADYDFDGDVTISDVTMIQKHLAGYTVGTGNVVVNYYAVGTEEQICASVDYEGRVGEVYDIPLNSSLGYVLNEETSPDYSSVVIPYGKTMEINYYFDYIGSDVSIHVKHNGDLTWDPTIWLWGSRKGNDTGTNYCNVNIWPGDTLTMGEDGWYTTTFVADDYDDAYNVIISDGGAAQSADCDGFTQLELWIVINDEKSLDKTKLIFYDVNPDVVTDATPIYQS